MPYFVSPTHWKQKYLATHLFHPAYHHVRSVLAAELAAD